MSTTPVQLVADRYRLVQPLGQGGMGRVWKARDEVLHREVAIKELVPPPGLTEDERREMRERSLREARAIAKLTHINVIRVFDVLRTDADPWIVMEYVPSRSLQDVIAQDGPLPPPRVAEIGLGVLSALRAVHRAGVLHRDVKPGNVLLGDDGRVVLTDFGLATVPGDPSVTRTGLVLGSPAYIAPERAKDGTAGPAGDLWSLGATLYAAVEGHSPYARASALATLAALATEPLAPPKNAGPLKPVLTGLLRKDPESRITAEEADRLLRRAAGRRSRGGVGLFDGARRPSPSGLRTRFVPLPRPATDPSGDGPAGPASRTPAPSVPDDVAPPTARRTAADDVAPSGGDDAPPPVTDDAPAGPDDVATTVSDDVATTVSDDVAPTAVVPAEPARGSAWIASSPVPASRSVDETVSGVGSGQPPASDRRRRGLLLGALAVLVLAVAVLAVWAGRDPRNDDSAPPVPSAAPESSPVAPAPPTPSAQPSPTGATPSATPDGSLALPAGWHMHHDPTGFSVPVPDGWRISREKYGSAADEVRVYFRDPQGRRMLLIDQTNSPRPDPVADWTRQEAARKGGYNGYRRVTIEAVDYWDKAADWEWTYNLDGVRVHVRNRGFVTAPDKAYGMFWRTPESEWDDNLDDFEVIARGFKPVRD